MFPGYRHLTSSFDNRVPFNNPSPGLDITEAMLNKDTDSDSTEFIALVYDIALLASGRFSTPARPFIVRVAYEQGVAMIYTIMEGLFGFCFEIRPYLTPDEAVELVSEEDLKHIGRPEDFSQAVRECCSREHDPKVKRAHPSLLIIQANYHHLGQLDRIHRPAH